MSPRPLRGDDKQRDREFMARALELAERYRGRTTLQLSLDEIERLHMPKRWAAEPLGALGDLEYAAGNKTKAIELDKKALAALADQTGTDVSGLRQYLDEQLATWPKTKPPTPPKK